MPELLSSGHLRFAVFGPLRAWRGSSELDLGPRQQRLALTLLLLRTGGLVEFADLKHVIWDNEPPQAPGFVQRSQPVARRLRMAPDARPSAGTDLGGLADSAARRSAPAFAVLWTGSPTLPDGRCAQRQRGVAGRPRPEEGARTARRSHRPPQVRQTPHEGRRAP